MNLPFNSSKSTTPDLEEILSRLPLDEQHLSQLSLQEKGAEEAERYAHAIFEMQYGDDIQSTAVNAEAQKEEIARLNSNLKTAEDHKDTLKRKLDISDEDKAKTPMSTITLAVQTLLAVAIAFLLLLGAHNFATLLIKSGEPFLTKPWMAYLTAAGAATMFAIIVKCFGSIPKHESTQRFIATITLAVGVVAGLSYLAVLSHLIKPDFAEAEITTIIPALGAPGQAAANANEADGWFGKSWSSWLLFFQFVAEATGAAGLSFFFSRNLKAHRAACARNNPDYIRAEQDVETAAGRLNSAKDSLGQMEGFLRVLGEARVMLISKAKAHVIALQQVVRMIMKVSCIKAQ